MPLISDINKEKGTSKRFKKKSYRPWDDESIPTEDYTSINENTVSNPSHADNYSEALHSIELNSNEARHEIEELKEICTSAAINQLTPPDLKKELRRLFGAQKIIIQYLLKQIEDNNGVYVVTKDITMEEFVLTCKLPPNTIKSMLQKLKSKKLLETYENKPGRGGFARYKIMNEVYTSLIKDLSN